MTQKTKVRLILASTSPRRIELLESLHLKFEAHAPNVDESVLPGEKPIQMVQRLSQAKASSVLEKVQRFYPKGCLVLAADTTVVAPGSSLILGKPESTKEACKMLGMLSGKTHTVFTSYSILLTAPGTKTRSITKVVRSDVKIRKLSKETIKSYVKTGEPMDKAGAYGAQGLGMALIQDLKGSYTNVVGLPVSHVLADLESLLKVSLFSWLGR